MGVDLNIKNIDIGKALEEHRLTFHHRLGGQRSTVTKPEDRRAVADDCHQVALCCIIIGEGSVFGDGQHGVGNPR